MPKSSLVVIFLLMNPFDSLRKRMTVLYQVDDQFLSVTKGAFDRLDLAENKENEQQTHDQLAAQAYRVLAVAYKLHGIYKPSDTVLEKDINFAGFVGIIDPARKESSQAVAIAKQAGIKTVMITGDQLLTAKKIAEEVGILTEGKK